MCIPPLCSNLLYPHSSIITHLYCLVDTGSLLHSAPTSCSLLLRNLHGYTLWYIMCYFFTYSDILHPPSLTFTCLHSWVYSSTLLHSAPTSYSDIYMSTLRCIHVHVSALLQLSAPFWSNNSTSKCLLHTCLLPCCALTAFYAELLMFYVLLSHWCLQ
jgi:hypothetical protein